jgi:hypothetical protein
MSPSFGSDLNSIQRRIAPSRFQLFPYTHETNQPAWGSKLGTPGSVEFASMATTEVHEHSAMTKAVKSERRFA